MHTSGSATEVAVDGPHVEAGRDGRESSLGVRREDDLTQAEAGMKIAAPFWSDPRLAGALASRDIARIFGYLQGRGFSQRRIAALTGQSQSEISEILGGRTVTSYPVLERIAIGLGIPRGLLGLAYDAQPEGGDEQPATPTFGSTAHMEIAAIVRAVLAAVPMQRDGEPLTAVGLWTGLHSRVLRESMRMSVRDFARDLGVSSRAVSKWEAGGLELHPRPFTQAVLDTCLSRLSGDNRQRFNAHLTATLAAMAHLSSRSEPIPQPSEEADPCRYAPKGNPSGGSRNVLDPHEDTEHETTNDQPIGQSEPSDDSEGRR